MIGTNRAFRETTDCVKKLQNYGLGFLNFNLTLNKNYGCYKTTDKLHNQTTVCSFWKIGGKMHTLLCKKYKKITQQSAEVRNPLPAPPGLFFPIPVSGPAPGPRSRHWPIPLPVFPPVQAVCLPVFATGLTSENGVLRAFARGASSPSFPPSLPFPCPQHLAAR